MRIIDSGRLPNSQGVPATKNAHPEHRPPVPSMAQKQKVSPLLSFQAPNVNINAVDINALEKIYKNSKRTPSPNGSRSGFAGGVLKVIISSVAPFLQSTAGQTRAMQFAEMDIKRLGIDPNNIGRVWSPEQRDYFVHVSALARQRTPSGDLPLNVVFEIFKRTALIDSGPSGSGDADAKIALYENLKKNTTDPTTRKYAENQLRMLLGQSGAGRMPPNGRPPLPKTTESDCPTNWNRNASLNDGRHRFAALRSLYATFGDFMVPITATAVDQHTGRRKDIYCEVPVSQLLDIRFNFNGELGSRGVSRDINWRNLTPDQVRAQIQKNPHLRIKVSR